MLSDGLHLSQTGALLAFGAIRDKIVLKWPELHPQSMPFDLPAHMDIDHTNVTTSFLPPSAVSDRGHRDGSAGGAARARSPE